MGRNTATINYAVGSLLGNAFNMYVFGSGILTSLTFVWNLVTMQSGSDAVGAAINYFIVKLTPFPVDEFLTASGFGEVTFNVMLALCIGLLVGSLRYRKNRYPGRIV